MINIKNIFWVALLAIAVSCNNGEEDSDAYGNFEATDIQISAEVNGRILQLEAEEGQRLKKSELIALIDTVPLLLKRNQLMASRKAAQSKIDQVQASVEVLKAQKGVLMKDVTRVYNMFRDKAATSKQVDDLQGQLQVMDKQLAGLQTQISSVYAELNVIDAQLTEVADQLARCWLTMPLEGTVLQRYAEKGEMAVVGRPVIKVADLDNMYLRAFVSGSQLPGIKIGQKVEVRFDQTEDSNQSLEGTISWISSSAEFTPKIVQTKEERVDLVYAIKVAIRNDGRVKIGMPGEVKF